MENEQKAYRSIFKATALFGGVQLYNILLSIIRTKIIAILLGVTGVGLLGLFNNTIAILANIARLGIDQGAIRDISIAVNDHKIGIITKVIKRWSFALGMAGFILTILLAPYLSLWTFGSDKYTLSFYWLSCTLLFDTLSKGQLSILQGLRKLKTLAKANLSGATISLGISIPIYHLYGEEGIVPAIIITYICSFLFTTFYLNKEKIASVYVSPKDTIQTGKGIIHLGVMLTISGIFVTTGSYLLNIYLNHYGGIKDVGLYQAGFNLIDKYIGIIFIAISTDYYPRLASVCQDNQAINKMINQQSIFNLLILCPIICIFIPTAPLIVRILLSKDFLPILPFLSWAIAGIIFKVISNILGYVLIVKNNSKVFIMTDVISCITILVSSIIGYSFRNIEGIGIAFLFSYICYFTNVYWIIRKQYNIRINKELRNIIFTTICITMLSIWASNYHNYISYCLQGILIIISIIYSFRKLKKKLI